MISCQLNTPFFNLVYPSGLKKTFKGDSDMMIYREALLMCASIFCVLCALYYLRFLFQNKHVVCCK